MNVIMFFLSETELIKNVPLTYEGQDVLLAPIVKFIKNLGKNIKGQSISYYSEKDQMDVFVGIDPINDDVKIPRQDFTDKLQIKAKENSQLSKQKIRKQKEGPTQKMSREVAHLQEYQGSLNITGKRQSKKVEVLDTSYKAKERKPRKS